MGESWREGPLSHWVAEVRIVDLPIHCYAVASV